MLNNNPGSKQYTDKKRANTPGRLTEQTSASIRISEGELADIRRASYIHRTSVTEIFKRGAMMYIKSLNVDNVDN